MHSLFLTWAEQINRIERTFNVKKISPTTRVHLRMEVA
jgi:hypothetical protein